MFMICFIGKHCSAYVRKERAMCMYKKVVLYKNMEAFSGIIKQTSLSQYLCLFLK